MLSIQHLSKIYSTKGGSVKALDDISLDFEDRGLVFLLGKSGSGKSTLLNLIGGLDEPTEGEVVVMGKSSKDFSGSDFDSYRNTFVGFVFQEYNVLNEFNVEENVSLALELRGETKSKEKVRSILKEVELEPFAKRKPNTLSGGQKQRVAIARALVKDPQIILADEPTGALDSTTGKQVFETLKRLSRSRLVLVVSHDREFAERYGDRVVELQDGKVISDVSKVKKEGEFLSEHVKKTGENVLTVEGGKLSEEDLRSIESFLSEEGEIVLAKKEEASAFKRLSRIDEDGSREEFLKTPPIQAKEEKKAEFLRSKLPVRKAIKIGVSSLKYKPVRLAFTILLSVVSFVMFGLFSTMMFYDGRSVLARSFLDSEMEYISLKKSYRFERSVTYQYREETRYDSLNPSLFTPEEAERFSQKDKKAIGACRLTASPSGLGDAPSEIDYYLSGTINKIAFAPEESKLRENLVGNYPKEDDEIAISSFFFDCLSHRGFYPAEGDKNLSEELIKPQSPQEILGKKILLGGEPFTISAVFQSGDVPSKYDKIKEFGSLASEFNDFEALFDNLDEYLLYLTYGRYIQEGVHSLALTTERFPSVYAELLQKYTFEEGYSSLDEPLYLIGNSNFPFSLYETAVFQGQSGTILLDPNKTSLEKDEILIPLGALDYVTDDLELSEEDREALDKAQLALLANAGGEKRDDAVQTIRKILSQEPTVKYGVYDWESSNYGKEEYIEKGSLRIAGFISGRTNFYCAQEFYDTLSFYMVEKTQTNYVPAENEVYSLLLVPFEHSERGFFSVYDKTEKVGENDVVYSIANVLASDVRSTNEVVETLSVVFLIVGLVLAVFSSLLLFNFISVSISNKKKEIGILRAVGARGVDVFKIFFSESGVIVGICTLLALIGAAILSAALNRILRGELGLDVTLFVFGPLPILVMIALALFVAIIATFLPVFLAARKKPVESIRAL